MCTLSENSGELWELLPNILIALTQKFNFFNILVGTTSTLNSYSHETHHVFSDLAPLKISMDFHLHMHMLQCEYIMYSV